MKSKNHQNQHAYLQCIYRNIQQSKVLKNVEGVIKYLNAVPVMYHSMDPIALLYDNEIDKCLQNLTKINFSPFLIIIHKTTYYVMKECIQTQSGHFESFKEHKN